MSIYISNDHLLSPKVCRRIVVNLLDVLSVKIDLKLNSYCWEGVNPLNSIVGVSLYVRNEKQCNQGSIC